MILSITSETRSGATVQLTPRDWRALKHELGQLRKGKELAAIIDAGASTSQPFRVRLTIPQLSLLESAAARIHD